MSVILCYQKLVVLKLGMLISFLGKLDVENWFKTGFWFTDLQVSLGVQTRAAI